MVAVFSVAVADFDADDDWDIVRITNEGISVLINAGNSSLPLFNAENFVVIFRLVYRPPSVDQILSPLPVIAVGDIDGDGLDDIVG